LDGEGFHSDEEGTGEFLDRFGQYAELKFWYVDVWCLQNHGTLLQFGIEVSGWNSVINLFCSDDDWLAVDYCG
jgi:hypothetical protein